MHAFASVPFAALSIAAVTLFPAHAAVIDSTVENGDTLTEAPESFSVTMNEDILQVAGVETANVLYIQDADGNYYGDGCVTVDGSTASIEPALGESGEYTFSYTVVSSDTHPVSDTFNFTWEAPADFTPVTGTQAAPECGVEADPTESDATESEGESEAQTADESTTADAEGDAEPSASDDAQTEDEPGALPGWAFALISIVLVALVLGVIIGNWVKARRQIQEGRQQDDNTPDEKL